MIRPIDRKINAYIALLLITVIGAGATLALLHAISLTEALASGAPL